MNMLASSNGLGNQPFKLFNEGSNPFASTKGSYSDTKCLINRWIDVRVVNPNGGLAQMVEQSNAKTRVLILFSI